MKKNILKVLLVGALSFNVVQANSVLTALFSPNKATPTDSVYPSDIGLKVIKRDASLGFKLVVEDEFNEPVYGIGRYFTHNEWLNSRSMKIGVIDDKYLYLNPIRMRFYINRMKIKGSPNTYNVEPYWVPYTGPSHNGSTDAFTGKYIVKLKEEDVDYIKNSDVVTLIILGYNGRSEEVILELKK